LPTHLIIRFLNVNIPETLNLQYRTCIYRQTINLQTHQVTEYISRITKVAFKYMATLCMCYCTKKFC